MLFYNEDSPYAVRMARDIVENEINAVKKQIEDYFSPFHIPDEHKKLMLDTFEDLAKEISLLAHYQANRNLNMSHSGKNYVNDQIKVIEKKNNIRANFDKLRFLVNEYCSYNKKEKQNIEASFVDLRMKMYTYSSYEVFLEVKETKNSSEK